MTTNATAVPTDRAEPTHGDVGALYILRNAGAPLLALDRAAVEDASQAVLDLREGVGHAMKALAGERGRGALEAMHRLQAVDSDLGRFEALARVAAARMAADPDA